MGPRVQTSNPCMPFLYINVEQIDGEVAGSFGLQVRSEDPTPKM